MKIEGPGQSQATSRGRKSGSAGKAGQSFGDFLTDESSANAPARATQNIAMLDTLLALQGTDDPTARAARRRARERSGAILNALDEIRIKMLSGNLTVGHMIDVADVVASHREKIKDPGLTALMDEIDLRAQVELAKMRAAMEQTI
ncbi:MAG: flagellar assembly protein FliX [Alphaproteobacteria bacterium]|nr:flagellar assembly protein FliX [Alphaproteobacteria bacterium]